jgi:hypothetical protein
MSYNWLEDMAANTVYKFKAEDGTIATGTSKQLSELCGKKIEGEPGESFELDEVVYSYAGFEPNKVNTRTAVEFEKNGRKAVAIRDRDGKTSYVSKTKINYQRTGKVESVYTKDYEEIIEKNVQKELQQAQFVKKNQPDPMKEMLKNLSDGEYVSDGVNFMRADGYEEQVKSAKPKAKEA